ncbi:MAG TPA: hypothetical protein VJX31_01800, partial [Casimicrobiaceae bacterium]|nr:hypothetical protein [Casimicrobiaceae bacterium]
VLTVSGAGSTFGTGGALSIGGNVSGPGGTGALGIAGGTVSAAAVNVWNTGQLALAIAGSIEAATVTVDAPFNVSLGGGSIAGDLVLTPAAAMSIDFDPSAGLAVSGSATLAGTLTIYLDGTVVPGQYTLIEADGGLGGSTFASVTVTPPDGTTAEVTYDDTHVYVVIASSVPDDLLFRDGFDGTP